MEATAVEKRCVRCDSRTLKLDQAHSNSMNVFYCDRNFLSDLREEILGRACDISFAVDDIVRDRTGAVYVLILRR